MNERTNLLRALQLSLALSVTKEGLFTASYQEFPEVMGRSPPQEGFDSTGPFTSTPLSKGSAFSSLLWIPLATGAS